MICNHATYVLQLSHAMLLVSMYICYIYMYNLRVMVAVVV